MIWKKMLSFGGDHYITLPILHAYSNILAEWLLYIFDVHTDYYNNDNLYDHGFIIWNAVNEKLIDSNRSIQIGIRTEYSKECGFTVLDAEYVNTVDINIVLKRIIFLVQSSPVYLIFDIDCLDPGVSTGTGTPVIGGLTTCCVLKLIRGLSKLHIIGIDIVEVSPIYDCAQIAALAAATLGLEILYTQASY